MKGRLVSRRLRSQDELGCGAGRNRPVWRLQAGLGCAHMTRGDILSTEVSRAAHPGPGARTGPGAAETPDRDKRQPPRLERGERGGQEMETGGALGTWSHLVTHRDMSGDTCDADTWSQRAEIRARECQCVMTPGPRVLWRNKSLSGPKPGPVSIIRCEPSWGRHQRHAMRWEAAELTELTFPKSHSESGQCQQRWIVMNHLGRSQPASPGVTEAGVCGDWGGHRRMPRCSQLPSSQSPHLPANFCEY